MNRDDASESSESQQWFLTNLSIQPAIDQDAFPETGFEYLTSFRRATFHFDSASGVI